MTVLLIALATSIFGVTTGLLLGLSQSPVVGIALPILFSILGGTSGFYFAKADLNSTSNRRTVQLASLATTLLCIGTIAGTALGIESRTSLKPWSVIASQSDVPVLPPETDLEEGIVEWLLLDARLHLMGLGASERRMMIQRIHSRSSTSITDRILHEITWLRETLERIMPPEGEVQRDDEWLAPLSVLRAIEKAADEAELRITETAFEEEINNLVLEVGHFSDDDDDREYLEHHPEAASLLSEYTVRLKNLDQTIESLKFSVTLLNDRLDEFLSGNQGGLKLSLGPSRGLASND